MTKILNFLISPVHAEGISDKISQRLGINTDGTIAQMIAPFLFRIIDLLFALAGIIAVLAIIISGYTLVTSGGNEENIKRGTKGITNAVLGLVITLTSYLLLRFIATSIGLKI